MPDFPPMAGTPSILFRRRYLALALVVSVGTGLVIAILLLDLVFKTSGSDPLIEIAIITLLIWIFPTSYVISRARDAYLLDGVLHLPLPTRRATGKRTWEVPLGDVVGATGFRHEDGDSGVMLTLNDGTQVRLWLSDLPRGGSEFLRTLLDRFGR